MADRRDPDTKPPQSRHAPEPEGPDEISRRFQRMNRQGPLGGLASAGERLGGLGKKPLQAVLVTAGAVALVIGFFFDLPFMDIAAVTLIGALVSLLGGKDRDDPDKDSAFERLLRRFGDPLSNDERSGDR